jgi:hypothetical protein
VNQADCLEKTPVKVTSFCFNKAVRLPSELVNERNWRTREDPKLASFNSDARRLRHARLDRRWHAGLDAFLALHYAAHCRSVWTCGRRDCSFVAR